MTVTAACQALLRYFSPEEREIPNNTDFPGRNEDVLIALNGAFQEIAGIGPAWPRRRDGTIQLKGPTAITISVTADSTSATIASADWESWMEGCTVCIGGTNVDNRILSATVAASGDATVTLLRPYDGNTGDESANVLHDSITLSSDVIKVLKPISIVGGGVLSPAPSPLHLHGILPEHDYDRHLYETSTISKAATTGNPSVYFVDTHAADTEDPVFRILINPAPHQSMWLDWREKVGTPRYTNAADATSMPVAHDFAESILLPIAAQRLQSSDFFRADHAKDEIARQYKIALKLLSKSAPQGSPGISLRALY